MGDIPGGVTRRQVVVGVTGAAVGGSIGVLVFSDGGDDGIATVEPNDNGEAELGELRWLLEENAGLDVTAMTYEDDVIEVTYRSTAKQAEGETERLRRHAREVRTVLDQFRFYVDNDGTGGTEPQGQRLSATVRNRFSGQPDGYYIEREWMQALIDGESDLQTVFNRVLQTSGVATGAGTTTRA